MRSGSWAGVPFVLGAVLVAGACGSARGGPAAPRAAAALPAPSAAPASSPSAVASAAPPLFTEPQEPATLAVDAPLPPFTAAPPSRQCAKLRAALPRSARESGGACASPAATWAALDEALASLAATEAAARARVGACFDRETGKERERERAARFPASVPRDAALAELERCATLPPGWVRTLRAALVPACADVLAEPALAQRAELAPRFVHALHGLALAARLARLDERPPAFNVVASDGAAFERYVTTRYAPWVAGERARLAELASWVARLPPESQGGAFARIALADAESRYLQRALDVRPPEIWKKDQGLRERLYTRLHAVHDAEPSPRVVARDAAVRATAIAALGGARSDAWRTAFAERLADLLAPAVPLPSLERSEVRMALAVPPALLPEVLGLAPTSPEGDPLGALADRATLAAALYRGGSPELRRAVAATRDEALLEVLGRAEVAVAAESVDPLRAAAAGARLAGLTSPQSPERELLLALAQDLAELPPDAFTEPARPAPRASHLLALGERTPARLVAWLATLDAALLEGVSDYERARGLLSVATGRQPEDAREECVWRAQGERPAFLAERGCSCPHVLVRSSSPDGWDLGPAP